MSLVSIKGVQKSFGPLAVLKGVSIEIARGDVVAIIGRSGSGKSTLLRCINGLETYEAGSIEADGLRDGGGKRYAGAKGREQGDGGAGPHIGGRDAGQGRAVGQGRQLSVAIVGRTA